MIELFRPTQVQVHGARPVSFLTAEDMEPIKPEEKISPISHMAQFTEDVLRQKGEFISADFEPEYARSRASGYLSRLADRKVIIDTGKTVLSGGKPYKVYRVNA